MTGAAAPGSLDHVVVNVLRRMDEAADLFAALGFRLTPRGHHSLGSINHLMMVPGAYLELVGLPETGPQRQELKDSPFGLNGLVVASADADTTHDRLAGAGFEVGSPVAFSRPVALDGGEAEARFRTVRLPASLFPAGRVYHCQHLTPDLVWRPEWFAHPNGFTGLDGVTVESPTPEAEARLYAAACGAVAEPGEAGWRIRLGDASVNVVPGPHGRFAALTLRFADLDGIEARARALPGAEWTRRGKRAGALTLPAFGLHLRCGATS